MDLALMALGVMALAVMGLSLLAAVSIWLVSRRVPKVPLAFAAASFCVMIAAGAALPPGYEPGEVDRVARIHREFAPRLEAYRRQHGVYPPTLEAAGIPTPRTRYGPLDYRTLRSEDGVPSYSVSVGDYGENGFVAYWESDWGREEWRLDM